METHLPTPTTARVYVNLLEGISLGLYILVIIDIMDNGTSIGINHHDTIG